MTEPEKKRRIEELRRELKELEAVPRSDWHKAFEAFLNLRIAKYDGVRIDKEVEIGVNPPRADFIILTSDGKVDFEESIFRIFRKVNIIEYKSHEDSLNEAVIYKTCGYAATYIGTAAHERGISRDQVTVTIFRAVKNARLFSSWEKAGRLVKTGIPGIYQVLGFFDLPFQIVITGELEGAEYAACRVIAAKVREADIQQVVNSSNRVADEGLKDYYRTILTLMAEKHYGLLSTVIRRTSMSTDALLDILKDDIDRIVDERLEQERKTSSEQLEQERRAASEQLEQERKTASEQLEQERRAASEQLEQERRAADEQIHDIIKNVMEAYHITAGEAMDVLKIPQPKREYYSEHILHDV